MKKIFLLMFISMGVLSACGGGASNDVSTPIETDKAYFKAIDY